MTNGSEHLPEGVRIPRTQSYPLFGSRDQPNDPAVVAAHERRKELAIRLSHYGYPAYARHDGVLLTEDAARAVLARLEEGK